MDHPGNKTKGLSGSGFLHYICGMQKQYTNLVFDFGGVLVDWNPRYLYDRYFEDPQRAQWFIANICTSEWNVRSDIGEPFSELIAELKGKYPQWSDAIDAYLTRWEEMLGGTLPGMENLLKSLKAKGYGLYGLSNWSGETFRRIEPSYPIFSLLDGFLLSGEEKLIKPDPAFYERLLCKYSLKAQDCLFVDDRQENVDAALKLGFGGLRFITPRLFKEDLEIILKDNF